MHVQIYYSFSQHEDRRAFNQEMDKKVTYFLVNLKVMHYFTSYLKRSN